MSSFELMAFLLVQRALLLMLACPAVSQFLPSQMRQGLISPLIRFDSFSILFSFSIVSFGSSPLLT